MGLIETEKKQFRQVLPAYLTYTFFHFLAAPVLGIRGWVRAKRRYYDGLIWLRLSGGTKPPRKEPWMLIYGGGLGEVRVAARVAQDLKTELDLPVHIVVHNHDGLKPTFPGIPIGVSPFNNIVSSWLFLRRWKPAMIWVVEFWDNHHMKTLAAAMGIPTVVFNVPITESAAQEVIDKPNTWWRWLPVGLYAVQQDRHRDRIKKFGVPDEQIRVTGLLGMGIPDPPEGVEEIRAKWRKILRIEGDDAPIILAGSTWPEDEDAVLEAFAMVRTVIPNARLIIAFRHEHGVPAMLSARGLAFSLRSDPEFRFPDSGIGVLDTRGELREVYSVADIAFVGGTFIESLGGHTPTEALSWQIPITTGPHFSQQVAAIEHLRDAGCLRVTQSPEELGRVWIEILSSRAAREEIAANAKKVLDEQKGKAAEFYRSLF